MKTSDEILLIAKMIESGIVPYGWPLIESRFQNALSTLDPTQRRFVTRKFRKLWRRVIRSFKEIPEVYRNMKHAAGMGLHETELTHQQRVYRVYVVREYFREDIQNDIKKMRTKN